MLIGHLGEDPDIRYTNNGTMVANFSMATNRPVKNGDKWEERPDWHKIVAWKRLAEVCDQYLEKGSFVFVEGRLQTRSWTDSNERKNFVTEVCAQNIQMLGRNTTKSSDALPNEEIIPESSDNDQTSYAEDDIPF